MLSPLPPSHRLMFGERWIKEVSVSQEQSMYLAYNPSRRFLKIKSYQCTGHERMSAEAVLCRAQGRGCRSAGIRRSGAKLRDKSHRAIGGKEGIQRVQEEKGLEVGRSEETTVLGIAHARQGRNKGQVQG